MIYYVTIDENQIIQTFSDTYDESLIAVDSDLPAFEVLGGRLNADGSISQVKKVPKSVTMRQARRVLFDADLYQKVDAAIKQAGGKALIDWEYSSTLERSSPMIETIADELKLSNKEIDELFIAAAKEILP